MNFTIDLNTVLLALIGGLLTVIAWFAKGAYYSLVQSQRDLFSKYNKVESRVSALEKGCEIRHEGGRKC
ncbi:hypothetical protein ADMFC3_12640 [Geovibrio sp. ADMFC3]